MKNIRFNKPKFTDILFLVVVVLLIIPQSRKPIQVLLNKAVVAVINPSKIQEEKQEIIASYDWELKDSQAHNFNFEQTKEKVVLVNFWATWCPPCIAEMPSLQKLYNDYQGKIEFVFVSSEQFKDIIPFIEKNKYSFKVYRPVSNYNEIFEVKGIPRTFLIDKKGKIIIDKTGAANWNSELVRNTINELIKQ